MDDSPKDPKIAGLPKHRLLAIKAASHKNQYLLRGVSTMKRLQVATLISIALLVPPVFANNGAIKIDFDFPVSFFVGCLGESVSGTIYVTTTYHEFDTPSGTHHLIDNWKFRYEFVGDSTLREWIGKGTAPGGGSVTSNGEKFFWTESAHLLPVHVDGIEDGPKWRYNNVVQYRWDENGVLTKEFINFSGFRCQK
jgi:hypothetical protein